MRTIAYSPSLTMVINDFNLVRPRIGPPKADAILLIDANAMLPCPNPTEPLKTISWRYRKVVE